MKTITAILFAFGILGTLESLTAQEMPTPQPLPQHQWLQQIVGDWTVTSDAKMTPDAEPMRMEFEETVRAIGSYWVQSEINADFAGTPFTAQMTLGYDPAKKAFVGTWIDTMQAHMWLYRGSLDAAQKVLTLEAEGPDLENPAKMRNFRDVITVHNKDHRTLSSAAQGDDGTWTQFQTAEYRRKTKTETATFAAGCFWCVEAVLERLDGVSNVESGYMGGHVDKPTYKQICNGDTGHAEVVQLQFDPAKISYTKLLGYFFALHDPTTLNRQGNDVGTQYRSAIFCHSDAQRETALAAIKTAQQAFESPIVTEVATAGKLWMAEDYHQDYWTKNPGDRYCNAFIPSKLKKLGLDK